MPGITGLTEITLSVRDVQLSDDWYRRLLDMNQTYDHTSDDGKMRYICLVEPKTAFVLCLVGHADNPGSEFNEFQTGLDHLEFVVAKHDDLADLVARLDEMGVEHSGVTVPTTRPTRCSPSETQTTSNSNSSGELLQAPARTEADNPVRLVKPIRDATESRTYPQQSWRCASPTSQLRRMQDSASITVRQYPALSVD